MAGNYDVIVMVEGHGCYNTKSVGEIRLCNMVRVPEGMHATFLEAVPCGVTNFSEKDWAESTMEKCDQLKYLGPTRRFVDQLQDYLKEEQKEYVKQYTIPILKRERKAGNTSDEEFLRQMEAFARVDAWEIRNFTREYPDRSYTVTPTVIYPEGLTLGSFKSRSSLLEYLSREFTNPLIIDNTCGGVYADSPTGSRHAARDAKKLTRAGRKRRKSMKRPKVKKLIYFA